MSEIIEKICRGCLSASRNVIEFSKEISYLYQTIVQDIKVENESSSLGLCTYCTATLMKLYNFRMKCLKSAETLKSLSTGENDWKEIVQICNRQSKNSLIKESIFNISCLEDEILNKHKEYGERIDFRKTQLKNQVVNNRVIYGCENEYIYDLKLDLNEIDILEKLNTINGQTINEGTIVKNDKCVVKSEYYSDGFDSEDDKLLTDVKEVSHAKKLKKLQNKDRKKEKRKKLKQSDRKYINKEIKHKVKKLLSCDGESDYSTPDQLNVNIKEEIDEETSQNGVMKNGLNHNIISNNKRFSSRAYRFNDSNIQFIKQSIEDIHKELELTRESISYQSAPYKCQPCAKYFMTDISLSLHNQRHSETSGPMLCDICTQRYSNYRSLSIHRQTHTDRYKCIFVGPDIVKNPISAYDYDVETSNPANKESEKCEDTNVTDKKICGRVFAARSAALKHVLKHTGEQMMFHCHVCGKTTNCGNTHQKHVRSHSVVKKYACPECNKEFKNSTTRNLHVMRVHTGVRHFTCPSCPMTFVNKTALVAHSVKHSTHREFYCVECDMYFKSASILKCHLTTSVKHSDPNTFKFQCSLCPKRYPLLYRLKDHIESAHSRKGHCVCDVCGATYHTAAGLRRHHRQKHSRGTLRERKHKCTICDKAFLTKQTLESHQLTHTGERPYPCQLCGRQFRHKGALWTHNKLVHNKNAVIST